MRVLKQRRVGRRDNRCVSAESIQTGGERVTASARHGPTAARGRESPGQGRGKIVQEKADREGVKGLRGVQKGVRPVRLMVKNM